MTADGNGNQPSTELLDEVERLRAWKREALAVLAAWDQVWEALGRPGLGESKAAASVREVERLLVPAGRRCGR